MLPESIPVDSASGAREDQTAKFDIPSPWCVVCPSRRGFVFVGPLAQLRLKKVPDIVRRDRSAINKFRAGRTLPRALHPYRRAYLPVNRLEDGSMHDW